MSAYHERLAELRFAPKAWLVTGVAGYIGSYVLEALLKNGQRVVGLDDLSTGRGSNLDAVRTVVVGNRVWRRSCFLESNIAHLEDCREAIEGVDVVLHQAALGSVPRSLEDPLRTNRAKVDGFLNMLVAARDAGVKRFVHAAYNSTYGDHPGLPKVEETIGRPLSPYAMTKYVNEFYAEVFGRHFSLKAIGLRYFNVLGPRQDPEGAYAAVTPRWIGEILDGTTCTIHGEGHTRRDFCFVANAVQANVLAATTNDPGAIGNVYDVAVGQRTSLNDLYRLIRDGLAERLRVLELWEREAVHGPYREGDVLHSLADIGKARRLLGYDPGFTLPEGLALTLDAFVRVHVQAKT